MKKYQKIYADLKSKIEAREYELEAFLPSENVMTKHYDCSRNTLRNALSQLAQEGYIQSIHGKGVRVIFHPQRNQSRLVLDGIESFKDSLVRNNQLEQQAKTEIKVFAEMIVNSKLEELTSFPIGMEIYYIQRVRYINDQALIIDHNYFRKDIVEGLTKDIAISSIYKYIEKTLNQKIVRTSWTIMVEKATEEDLEILDLEGFDCVCVATKYVFNDQGMMFEFSKSRHHPKHFVFSGQAKRNN